METQDMYITHVSPLTQEEGFLAQLPFLCTEHPDSLMFQIGFEETQVLTFYDVQERVEEGLYVALESPVRIDSQARVPWLTSNGHIWLLDKGNPQGDLQPKLIGSLH